MTSCGEDEAVLFGVKFFPIPTSLTVGNGDSRTISTEVSRLGNYPSHKAPSISEGSRAYRALDSLLGAVSQCDVAYFFIPQIFIVLVNRLKGRLFVPLSSLSVISSQGKLQNHLRPMPPASRFSSSLVGPVFFANPLWPLQSFKRYFQVPTDTNVLKASPMR